MTKRQVSLAQIKENVQRRSSILLSTDSYDDLDHLTEVKVFSENGLSVKDVSCHEIFMDVGRDNNLMLGDAARYGIKPFQENESEQSKAKKCLDYLFQFYKKKHTEFTEFKKLRSFLSLLKDADSIESFFPKKHEDNKVASGGNFKSFEEYVNDLKEHYKSHNDIFELHGDFFKLFYVLYTKPTQGMQAITVNALNIVNFQLGAKKNKIVVYKPNKKMNFFIEDNYIALPALIYCHTVTVTSKNQYHYYICGIEKYKLAYTEEGISCRDKTIMVYGDYLEKFLKFDYNYQDIERLALDPKPSKLSELQITTSQSECYLSNINKLLEIIYENNLELCADLRILLNFIYENKSTENIFGEKGSNIYLQDIIDKLYDLMNDASLSLTEKKEFTDRVYDDVSSRVASKIKKFALLKDLKIRNLEEKSTNNSQKTVCEQARLLLFTLNLDSNLFLKQDTSLEELLKLFIIQSRGKDVNPLFEKACDSLQEQLLAQKPKPKTVTCSAGAIMQQFENPKINKALFKTIFDSYILPACKAYEPMQPELNEHKLTTSQEVASNDSSESDSEELHSGDSLRCRSPELTSSDDESKNCVVPEGQRVLLNLSATASLEKNAQLSVPTLVEEMVDLVASRLESASLKNLKNHGKNTKELVEVLNYKYKKSCSESNEQQKLQTSESQILNEILDTSQNSAKNEFHPLMVKNINAPKDEEKNKNIQIICEMFKYYNKFSESYNNKYEQLNPEDKKSSKIIRKELEVIDDKMGFLKQLAREMNRDGLTFRLQNIWNAFKELEVEPDSKSENLNTKLQKLNNVIYDFEPNNKKKSFIGNLKAFDNRMNYFLSKLEQKFKYCFGSYEKIKLDDSIGCYWQKLKDNLPLNQMGKAPTVSKAPTQNQYS